MNLSSHNSAQMMHTISTSPQTLLSSPVPIQLPPPNFLFFPPKNHCFCHLISYSMSSDLYTSSFCLCRNRNYGYITNSLGVTCAVEPFFYISILQVFFCYHWYICLLKSNCFHLCSCVLVPSPCNCISQIIFLTLI